MNLGFISIDNFYDDPTSIRKIALGCEYFDEGYSDVYKLGGGPWPGQMSKISHSPNDVDKKVSKLLQKNLRQARQFDSGRFRISKEKDLSKNILHVDSLDNSFYAGVLYLSLPEHSVDKQGTIFYNSKDTGLDSPINKDELTKVIVNNEFNDLSKWNVNLISYMVYNRLIIYPANKFHGMGPAFGDSNENARLVQLFLWKEI